MILQKNPYMLIYFYFQSKKLKMPPNQINAFEKNSC